MNTQTLYRHERLASHASQNMGPTTRMFIDVDDGRPFAILTIGGLGCQVSVHLDADDATWLRDVAQAAANHLGSHGGEENE